MIFNRAVSHSKCRKELKRRDHEPCADTGLCFFVLVVMLRRYMFDIIYVTWFVQLASLLWSKFWYLYLIVRFSLSYHLMSCIRRGLIR